MTGEHGYFDVERVEHNGPSVQWVGTPGVKGPRWARLPLLTVGMLGTQVVWSVEMGYASLFLTGLGLSKSWMSLVFMAGPLSGLIVQPLIGAYADRSRSRFGRRRPFMLAGTAVAVVGMMLLAYAREVAGLLGLGNAAAIAVAILSIYLIDFSINAVMSTDRALIVDTLPPSQQEEGNAWAGRMMGLGGVAGFFVGGSVDLTKVLGWLGKTQLQILSLLTCLVLVLAHTSTSWAVTERVLLRDERPQSRAGLVSSLRAIWTNMFMLPVSIRTICYIQFFANLGWYPILFFTSLWVGDIYKHTTPQGDMTREEWESTAERAGSQALFMQAVISLAISVAAPFFVSDSGIMPARVRASYHRLAADEHGASDDADSLETPRSDVYKRHAEVQASSTLPQRAAAALASAIKAVRSGTAFRAIALPLPGLTLIRLWCGAQVLFVACMLATFFVSSVPAAYAVIATTGLAWALSQWAPFALLGELVLVDAPTEMRQLEHLDTRETEVVFAADTDDATPGMHSRGPSRSGSRSMSRSASQTHASHARLPSHETIGADTPHPLSRIEIPGTARKQSLDLNLDLDEDPDLALSPQQDEDLELAAELDTTVVLRHSTDSDASDRELLSPDTPAPSTADKAGLILGIHNVFIVLPQFAITFVSSIVFAVMDAKAPAGADKDAPTPYPTAVAIVFRIGGLAAAAGAFLSYRLAQRWGRLGP